MFSFHFHITVICFILSSFFVGKAQECETNETLYPTTTDQTLVSHEDYGLSDYLSNTHSCWDINQVTGYSLLLVVEAFSLESHATCDYDALTISTGSGESERFCGTSIFSSLVFSSCNLSLTFVTDGDVTSLGFSIRYRLIQDVNGSTDSCIGLCDTPCDDFSNDDVIGSATTPQPAEEGEEEGGGLSAGAIAGISVVAVLVVLGIFLFYRHRKKQQEQVAAQQQQLQLQRQKQQQQQKQQEQEQQREKQKQARSQQRPKQQPSQQQQQQQQQENNPQRQPNMRQDLELIMSPSQLESQDTTRNRQTHSLASTELRPPPRLPPIIHSVAPAVPPPSYEAFMSNQAFYSSPSE